MRIRAGYDLGHCTTRLFSHRSLSLYTRPFPGGLGRRCSGPQQRQILRLVLFSVCLFAALWIFPVGGQVPSVYTGLGGLGGKTRERADYRAAGGSGMDHLLGCGKYPGWVGWFWCDFGRLYSRVVSGFWEGVRSIGNGKRWVLFLRMFSFFFQAANE